MFMSKKPILILTALVASLIIALPAQAVPTTPVTVVDARNAVQQQINITIPVPGGAGGVVTGSGSVTVPAGKIFVLQFASFSVSYAGGGIPNGGGGILTSLSISVNGPHIDGSNGPVEHQFAPGSGNGGNPFNGGEVLFLYAQPGTTINVNLTASTAPGTTGVSASVSLSGYFVNP
jgi:hypothetical protein